VAEALHEQIIAAFKTLLEGTSGWYPPSRVIRAPAFYAGCLDASLSTIYTLVPVRVESMPLTSALGIRANLIVDLVLATRFKPDTERPFDQSVPIRWTVQSRLEQDAKARIAANYTLLGAGGAHLFTTVPVTDYASDLTYLQGWAVVYLRAVLRYIHQDRTP
jgi:hypothetical protein